MGVAVREVVRPARTDTGPALALAGVHPDGVEAVSIVCCADYVRLLALGAPPGLPSQILFDGGGQANTRSSEQPTFAAAPDAAADATTKRAKRRCSRFTPERRRQFPECLRAGKATKRPRPRSASPSRRSTQCRRRDAGFADAIDRAAVTCSTPRKPPAPPLIPRLSGPRPSTTGAKKAPTWRSRPTGCVRNAYEETFETSGGRSRGVAHGDLRACTHVPSRSHLTCRPSARAPPTARTPWPDGPGATAPRRAGARRRSSSPLPARATPSPKSRPTDPRPGVRATAHRRRRRRCDSLACAAGAH